MRFNAKRFALAAISCVFLWAILIYLSPLKDRTSFSLGPTHKSTINKFNIERRIELLERSVENELNDSKNLLQFVKNKLIKNEKNATEKPQPPPLKNRDGKLTLPVLVIACDRVTVKRCLDRLIAVRPDVDTFPIIVSQDCRHGPTRKVISKYITPTSGVTMIQQPDLSVIPLPRAKLKFQGYYKIARHYKFALGHVFDELGYEAVIIVEDDLDISDDFFEYFMGTYPLLKNDKSLWCISAWNDNGKKELIDHSRPELLHRTDFFPGLGWMMLSNTWDNLKDKWPKAFFDDWLREPEQSQGRSCIRPEISRTSTFGKEGVSKGLFFDLHLRFIQLNQKFVPFTEMDLTYLLKDMYDKRLAETIESATALSVSEVVRGEGAGEARVSYVNQVDFKVIAKKLGLMDDFRSGVPRTAYRGVVSCFHRGRRVYIVPARPFVKYDPSWN